MGNKASRSRNVLLIGLDGAGKTTLLYKLKLGTAAPTTHTFGLNLETIEYRDFKFAVWDIGGGDQNRLSASWRSHLKRVDAVIYVVDASNGSRLFEAAQVLREYFELDELRDAKLLVLANKQDQPSCMPLEMIQETLNLGSMTKNPHRVEKAVVAEGEGVYEGLDWLCKAIAGTL